MFRKGTTSILHKLVVTKDKRSYVLFLSTNVYVSLVEVGHTLLWNVLLLGNLHILTGGRRIKFASAFESWMQDSKHVHRR